MRCAMYDNDTTLPHSLRASNFLAVAKVLCSEMALTSSVVCKNL